MGQAARIAKRTGLDRASGKKGTRVELLCRCVGLAIVAEALEICVNDLTPETPETEDQIKYGLRYLHAARGRALCGATIKMRTARRLRREPSLLRRVPFSAVE